jgi:hypothetical protein
MLHHLDLEPTLGVESSGNAEGCTIHAAVCPVPYTRKYQARLAGRNNKQDHPENQQQELIRKGHESTLTTFSRHCYSACHSRVDGTIVVKHALAHEYV